MNEIRPDLPLPPLRFASLPIDARGYPVPWFVSWVDGVPEFRAMDVKKLVRAIKEKLCWICGGELKSTRIGRFPASTVKFDFVVGPMCAINRISSEPPSHLDCAMYAVRACPFLTKPKVERREDNLPKGCNQPAGVMVPRNPGVTLLWMTRSYKILRDGKGVLFQMGEPIEVLCFTSGRPSTQEEIKLSFDSGYEILRRIAEAEGQESINEAEKQVAIARRLLKLTA